MTAAEDEKLRLIAVSGTEGQRQAFLWNRYQKLRFQAGDTILADVNIVLTDEEKELLTQVGRLDLAVDGSPEDMLASIIAKVFQAGLDAAKSR